MNEISTRIWLDERVWKEIADRARAEGTTVRELIPQFVRQSLGARPSVAVDASQSAPSVPTSPSSSPASEPGLPVVLLSDAYGCGVCGAEVRLGGLSNHLAKHRKEQEASELERS